MSQKLIMTADAEPVCIPKDKIPNLAKGTTRQYERSSRIAVEQHGDTRITIYTWISRAPIFGVLTAPRPEVIHAAAFLPGVGFYVTDRVDLPVGCRADLDAFFPNATLAPAGDLSTVHCAFRKQKSYL